MNRHPFKYLLALAGAGLLAGAAAAGPIDFKSDYLPLERNLAFESMPRARCARMCRLPARTWAKA